METKLIVKYRRPSDRWVCPDCDAENDIGSVRCTVCGCEKNPSVSILKAWSPELERAGKADSSKRLISGPRSTSAGGYSSSGDDSSTDSSNVFWLVVASVLVLMIIVLIAQ